MFSLVQRRVRTHGVHFRRGFWRGCRRDDLTREFSSWINQAEHFWICHSLTGKMKEKTGSTVYKRKWTRASGSGDDATEVATRGERSNGVARRDATRRDATRCTVCCDASLLRKLDFSRLHARTTTGKSQTTENCPFHRPRDVGDARLNYVCIKVRLGIRRSVYCEVRTTLFCTARFISR